MPKTLAWTLFILGICHIVFGLARYRRPLAEAVAAGFVGQFKQVEVRRTAFWFMIFGPLLMLVGHIAIRAVDAGDLALLTLIGIYTLLTSVIGIAAFPASPFWMPLALSPLLIATGRGWLN